MKRLIMLCAVAVMLIVVTGCTTFEKNAYVSLESVQAVYDAGMSIAADMKVNGDITPEQWDDIAVVAVKVSAAGAIASKAMANYKEFPVDDNISTAKFAIQVLLDEAGFFIEKVETITGKKLPVGLKLLL
jgi:hypothetical protein